MRTYRNSCRGSAGRKNVFIICNPIGCLIITFIMLAGCGRSEPLAIANRDVFDAAVQAHLNARSMDLAIFEYWEFHHSDDGRHATAVIAMVYAGEGYSKARVRFRFSFERRDDSWKVVSHEQIRS